MRCHEARNLIAPYLDSELDAKTTLEIEQHLEACSDCARVFEAEASVDERIFKTFRQGQRTTPLWEKIESQIAPSRSHGIKGLWPFALAASLIIAIGMILFAKSRTLDLANAVEECHSAYVHQITTPEFNGPVPKEIVQQFAGRLDVAAFAYRPSEAAFTSSGARLCHVEGVPVALVLGHCANIPVSMIVFKKNELDHFPQTKLKLESGDPIACSRSGRYQFAARFVGGHVVCLVGDEPRPVLEDLLRTVRRADG